MLREQCMEHIAGGPAACAAAVASKDFDKNPDAQISLRVWAADPPLAKLQVNFPLNESEHRFDARSVDPLQPAHYYPRAYKS